MRIAFTKMHGLGNDFVVLDARETPLPPLDAASISALADRHTGIGCDQLVVLEPSDQADFRMRIYNCDGGEVESCGNASRAVARLHAAQARVETGGGVITLVPTASGARVDMGKPRFGWDEIPLAYAMDTLAMPVGWEDLENPVAVNVGNPHAVFFVDDSDATDLARLGPLIEHDPLFPQRVNVNVATVESRNAIRLRVWERGAGLTLACGTGACASAVAAIRRGLCDSPVKVSLPGGALQIEWDADGEIVMTGPACESFRGTFLASDFGIAG